MTLPVILAFARGDETDRRFWRDAMLGHAAGDGELAHARRLLDASGAIADTLARARHYGARAADALAGFPANPAKAALLEAVEFAVSRTF